MSHIIVLGTQHNHIFNLETNSIKLYRLLILQGALPQRKELHLQVYTVQYIGSQLYTGTVHCTSGLYPGTLHGNFTRGLYPGTLRGDFTR